MSLRLAYWNAAPDAVKAMRSVSDYLAKSELGKKLVELVYLRVSQINGCAFCCDMHASALRGLGETDQRLDCLAGWRDAPFFSERERAALGWAEALTHVSATKAPDADYAPARAQFSDKELADLTFAIAQINSWNRLSIGFRAQPVARKVQAAASAAA
jgi:AhpD family alkylhydroperoxidase